MKMPEPRAWIYTLKGMSMASTNRVHGVKAAPLYDKQALIDLLEEAAKECESEDVAPTDSPTGVQECIAARLRKLKETL
jgi:hypothetical protein